MDLQQWTWGKKQVHGVKMHWISGKEKVPGAVVWRDDHADCLPDMKGPIIINFLEKQL